LAADHPDWWIEQLEYLEAIDEPGGVRYAGDTGLAPRIVHSMQRRGLVTTYAKEVRPRYSSDSSMRCWVELTELGRRTFEEDLPPPMVRATRARWRY
jgi:hypothetical protein